MLRLLQKRKICTAESPTLEFLVLAHVDVSQLSQHPDVRVWIGPSVDGLKQSLDVAVDQFVHVAGVLNWVLDLDGGRGLSSVPSVPGALR